VGCSQCERRGYPCSPRQSPSDGTHFGAPQLTMGHRVLAGYSMRLSSRRTASERQVNARVGERAWERRSLCWLEPLPGGAGAVPECTRAAGDEPPGQDQGEVMTTGGMWDDQVVEWHAVPEADEAVLNPYGLIGYELVAVTPVTATGRLLAYLKRGLPQEAEEGERA
jgi:hypothetical protein